MEWRAEAAEIRDGEKAHRLEIADWSPPLGFLIKDSLFPHVTGGLRGRTVVITSIQVIWGIHWFNAPKIKIQHHERFQDFPWTILEEDDSGMIKTSGLVFAMLDEIASALNFSYSVVPPEDNSMGFRKKVLICSIFDMLNNYCSITLKGTNEFDGMIGQLINQEVFMAAAALTVIDDRQMYVNFSKPYDIQPYTFMYKRPTELGKEMMFIDPFQPLVKGFTM